MMLLTVQPAAPIIRPHSDGTGYDIRNAYDGYNVRLQIGNVSIAFDGRNEFKAIEGESYCNPVMQFSEYRDDPVRLHDTSFDTPNSGPDIAERIMFALAADLGYYIQPNGPSNR